LFATELRRDETSAVDVSGQHQFHAGDGRGRGANRAHHRSRM